MADALDAFTPRSLDAVARQLGLAPLEVVRLCGLAELDPPAGWTLTSETPGRLAELGGIEAPWLHDAALGAMERLRGILVELAARNLRGDALTRMDNTWRGLPPSQQAWLASAFDVLAELDILRVVSRPEGRMVSLAPSVSEPLQAFLDGGEPPPALARAVAAIQEESR
ncbi:MAG: hypothetical protein AAF602_13990 [Myxococcota bacterium]